MGQRLITTGYTTTFQAHWSGMVDDDVAACDERLLRQFHEEKRWEVEASIDLFACNPALMCDTACIHVFVVDFCEKNQLRRSGKPVIVHREEDARVAGYTLVQLLDGSHLVRHFIPTSNAVCLSVFSCSAYAPIQCATLCQQWFEAQRVHLSVLFRGQEQQASSRMAEMSVQKRS